MQMISLFRNDNHVEIVLPVHEKSHIFAARDNHEVLFRRISTWLINNKFIKTNIIDLGAWIGDNTIPWAKNISGTVYGIDPSENNCNFIKKVCDLNNISNVTVFQTAVSDIDEFLSTSENIDHCSFVNGGSTMIAATSLDNLHSQGKIKDIGYVHLDVEGMEFKVVQGMTEIIRLYQPIIAFEQHLQIDNILEIIYFLKSQKYIVFMINEILPGCREDCRNFLAFPSNETFENVVKYLQSYFGAGIFTRF
jgi:FkbM family methyltransferase